MIDEAITQTLAGRMAVLTLLPLSLSELDNSSPLFERIETLLHKGFYPKAHAENISTERLYINYIRLYYDNQKRTLAHVLSWKAACTLIKKLSKTN